MSEVNRAAYYAYTYYKVADAGFDAFIYAADSDRGSLQSALGTRADLYYAALMCGSNKAKQVDEYIDRITGASAPKLSHYKTINLFFEQSVETDLSSSLIKKERKLSLSASELCAMGGAYDVNVSSVTDEDGAKKQTINIRGNVAAVKAGLEAAKVAAEGVGGVVCMHVIPNPETDTEKMLKLSGMDKN